MDISNTSCSGYDSLAFTQMKNHVEVLNDLAIFLKNTVDLAEYVRDAGCYHGLSGVSYLYHRLYRQTGEGAFQTARDYWLEETLCKAVINNDTAGYKSYDSSIKENNTGLLGGIAGTGLVLLSVKNGSDLPDDFLCCIKLFNYG
jgi:lantibiotic modifying enzyme